MKTNPPLSALRHHVTGAIERGEKTAIAGIPDQAPDAGEAEHTPTPYHIGTIAGRVMAVYGPKGEQIAACDSITLPDEENRHNAAFIVRACNSHAGLVEALAEAMEIIEAKTGGKYLKARAVLQSAKE